MMVRPTQIAISMTTTDLLHFAILCLFIVHLRAITRWYSGDENPRAYLCAAVRKQDTSMRKWFAKDYEDGKQ